MLDIKTLEFMMVLGLSMRVKKALLILFRKMLHLRKAMHLKNIKYSREKK